MRKPLIAGNWKLNGSREANAGLVRGVLENIDASVVCDIMVCPPYVYLPDLAQLLAGTSILLGAQNVAAELSGAFTGEISAAMLKEVGASHVIVGHSERRALYGETDGIVAAKFMAAQAANLEPILCVGETLADREGGITMDVVGRQVAAVVDAADIDAFGACIVAYEPVWAIGTGLTATPEQAQEVHAHIRTVISATNAKIGAGLRILYGGSVKGGNAVELLAMDDIDGGLIGGASLDAAEFAAICNAAVGK
jgi:triosephosphate isomerase